MDWVETAILRPEYVVMGLHLGFNYHDLDWGETWPGLWWGVNIGTWIGVARVKVRCEYLSFRWCLDGGDTRILGLECRWYRIWMKVRHKSWDLNCIKMGPWRGWNSIYKTCMALRRHLDGVVKIILWPGLGWDARWMEVRWTSWNLDFYIWCLDGAGVQFWDLGWGEAHILKLAWVWDGARMELGCNFMDLNGDETSPKWRWNANVRTCIELRHGLDGEMLI